MAIELDDEIRSEVKASIQEYAREQLEVTMGNLQADALLDFFLEEVGPSIYNRAVRDVQERLQARLIEIDAELQESEFGYSHGRVRQGRRP